jgi:hypothetical protein
VTLIELLVVVALLALVGGIVSIKVGQAMQAERFATEVQLVIDKLRLAQNLMLMLNEDVKVHFKKETDSIDCRLSFECLLNKGWERELSRPHKLTTIRQVDFKGDRGGSAPSEVALEFMSGGIVMSKGVLSLSSGKGRSSHNKRYVCLPGYPAPILAAKEKPDLDCLSKSENNGELAQAIMTEVSSKQQTHPSTTP